VLLPDLELLRRLSQEQLPLGSLFVVTTDQAKEGSSIEVVLGLAGWDQSLCFRGTVLPPPEDGRPAGLLIELDDPDAAIEAVQDYIARAATRSLERVPPSGERRQHPRVAAGVRVKIRFQAAEQFREAYIKDISQGGLFVRTTDLRPPGTPVEVVLLPPGVEEGFVLHGVVAHVVEPEADLRQRPGIGVRFAEISPETRASIEAYLRTLNPLPEATLVTRGASPPPAAQPGLASPSALETGGAGEALLELTHPEPTEILADARSYPAQEPSLPAAVLEPSHPGAVASPLAEPQPPLQAEAPSEPAFGPSASGTSPTLVPEPSILESAPPSAAELGFAPLPDLSADLPPGPTFLERRGRERVQVKLRPTDLRRFRELCLREVSRGGVFVFDDQPQPPGTPVEVLLFAPGAQEPFRFEGDVVHVVRSEDLRAPGEFPGMGIRLSRIDDRDREAIEEIISRVPEEDEPRPVAEPPGPLLPPRAETPAPLSAPTESTGPKSLEASFRPQTGTESQSPPPPRVTPFLTAQDLIPGPDTSLFGPLHTHPPPFSGLPPTPAAEPLASHEPGTEPPPPVPQPGEPERGSGTVAVASAGKKATVVERRPDPRDPRRIQMVLRFQTLEDFRQIYEKDISRGGVFVGTEEMRPLRSSLDVVLMPPGSSSGITLRGEVVHVTPVSFAHPEIEPGMGIQFLDLTADKKAAIERRLAGEPEPVSEVFSPPEEPEEPPRRREPAFGRTAPPRVSVATQEVPGRRAPALERKARPRAPEVPQPPEVEEELPVVELEEAISTEEEPPVARPRPPPRPALPTRPGPPPRESPPAARPTARTGPDAELDRMLDQAFADIPGEPVEFPRPEASESAARVRPTESALVAPEEEPGGPAFPVEGGRISSSQARALLENLELSLRKSNYYDLLGVKPNASREKIRQAVDARMRAFLPETYRGKLDRETLSTLALGRSRLEAVREVLLDPERRAGYECSLGIFLVNEDELTKAEREARARVRKHFWEQYARENPVKVRKAEEFFKTALDDLRANDQQGALRNVRLALTFDPLCDRYVELLRKIQPKG
jgi:uncharacterized protein (TIGR02266 family)